MAEPSASERDIIERLADSFITNYRAGQRPSVDAYVEQYPELADQLRDLIAALMVLERNAPHRQRAGGLANAAMRAGKTPREIGEFAIVREIGRGGMGVVYEAIQQSLGRHVALKVLSAPGLLNPVHLERFRLEARSAGRLHHSHIVPVFGVGEHDGLHYYAMQFIAGQSLDQVIDELRKLRPVRDSDLKAPDRPDAPKPSLADGLLTGRFAAADVPNESAIVNGNEKSQPAVGDPTPSAAAPLSTTTNVARSSEFSSGSSGRPFYESVARVGLQVAEALAYAHSEGILHRDIKPSNLLLDAKGNTWVTDFGLAKAEECEALTQTGDFVGTLRYMAPERMEGWSDRRTDIYGLGATLYELLTLRQFFKGADRGQLLDSIRYQQPVTPTKIDPSVPRDLETIVLKAISKEPGARYHSAQDMADDLRRFLTDRPIFARRSTTLERCVRWCRRNPLAAGLLAIVALLVLSISVGSTVTAVRMTHLAESLQVESDQRFIEARLAEAQASRGLHQMGWRNVSLDALTRAARLGASEKFANEKLANEAIACMAPLDLTLAKGSQPWPSEGFRLRFDPEFTRYATSYRDGTCVIERATDNQEIMRFKGSIRNAHPRFSPGARFLSLAADVGSAVELWELTDTQPRLVLSASTMSADTVGFSADGRWFAVANPAREMKIYDLDLFALQAEWKLDDVRGIAFRPDGSELAVAGAKGITLHSIQSGQRTDHINHTLPVTQIAWTRDGKTIAGVDSAFNIGVWNRSTKTLGTLLDGATNGGITIDLHPTRPWLATGNWDGLRLWDWSDGRLLFSGPVSLANMQFSPDGKQLGMALAESDSARILSLDDGPILRSDAIPLATSSSYVSQLTECPWNSQGRLLGIGTPEGLLFWNSQRAEVVGKLATPTLTRFGFDDRGRLWTVGAMGIYCWNVQQPETDGAPIRVGPPETVGWEKAASPYKPQFSGASRLMGFNVGTAAYLVPTDALADGQQLAPTPGANFVALHGPWMAMGNVVGRDEVDIWDVSTNQCIARLATNAQDAIFSPDGHWLLTLHKNFALWRTDGWRLARRWSSSGSVGFAWSPSGSYFAISTRLGVISLVDPKSCHEFLRLESSANEIMKGMAFSQDGTKLYFVSNECRTVYCWDLAVMRTELTKIGIDVAPNLGGAPLGDESEKRASTVTVDYGPSWPH